MKEQNKFLLLFLHQYIQENNIGFLNRILNDEAFNDLHPSLLKSTLIITESIPAVESTRSKLLTIFEEKMRNH